MDILVFYSVLAILWPLAILIVGICCLANFKVVIYKIRLFIEAGLYLVQSKDKKWQKNADPARYIDAFRTGSVQRRDVVFVRHGESCWNDTFNKGKHRSALKFAIGFVPGLVKAVATEFYLFVTGQYDSWFYDSPLNSLGQRQAQELAGFLAQAPATARDHAAIALLLGEAGRSVIVSSNLRRALSTVVIAFADRLKKRRDEKILILPCLQEVSRNPDTLSITPPGKPFTPPFTDRVSDAADFDQVYGNQVDVALSSGNKTVKSNGLKRMQEFCRWVFEEDRGAVIVGGHSIWFRSFFREFLPAAVEHSCKSKKIANGGAVSFTLAVAQTQDGPVYMVEPESINVIYGGFA